MNKKSNNKSGDKVKADYNNISAHFSSTRSHAWPEMKIFASYIKGGMKVLDLGCGNGRLLSSIHDKKVDYLGIDSSDELIKIARETNPGKKFEIMDMADLNFENNLFDAVFAIASLHHLSTRQERQKALTEANRVLKTDEYFFVTVWNLWQKKYRKYVWGSLFKVFTGSTQFGDTFIPWRDSTGNILAKRYYYAYTLNSLKRDLESAGFKVITLKKSKWNIYAICRK